MQIISATGDKPGAKISGFAKKSFLINYIKLTVNCLHYITPGNLATVGISNVIGVDWRK